MDTLNGWPYVFLIATSVGILMAASWAYVIGIVGKSWLGITLGVFNSGVIIFCGVVFCIKYF